MATEVASFYDDLADNYHLIFENWDKSIETDKQPFSDRSWRNMQIEWRLVVLDCACGIGTQSLGLSMRGHRVVASDFESSVRRTR